MRARTCRLVRPRILLSLVAILGILPATGCIGLVANLIHAGWGDRVPARFGGLEEKRVAVVCLARSSLYGPMNAADEIATLVEQSLAKRVELIQIVDQEKIQEWTDAHGWNQIDYQELGAGLQVDYVIAIDILSLSLHDGNTMYRGRTDVQVQVYDLAQGGKSVYSEVLPQIVFPMTEGKHVTEVQEREFRRQFIEMVAAQIAHRFYNYDRTEDFGRDPTFVGF